MLWINLMVSKLARQSMSRSAPNPFLLILMQLKVMDTSVQSYMNVANINTGQDLDEFNATVIRNKLLYYIVQITTHCCKLFVLCDLMFLQAFVDRKLVVPNVSRMAFEIQPYFQLFCLDASSQTILTRLDQSRPAMTQKCNHAGVR